jgi:hypothetical protein
MPRTFSFVLSAFLLLSPCIRGQEIADFVVDPPKVRLSGPQARWTLLVHGKTRDGKWIDKTAAAVYRVANPDLVTIDEQGRLAARKDGATTITVELAGRSRLVPVQIQGSHAARRWHFENDITPILNRFSCNSSGCHAQAEGQNGFKLSVFGFDVAGDHNALTKEARGRRIFPAAPEASLFVAKPVGDKPHGGGVKIRKDSSEYQTMLGWIRAGAPLGDADAPSVVTIRVEPAERLMVVKGKQQLRVIATYSDGAERDVTHHSRFQTNAEGAAAVSPDGLVSVGATPGEFAVMAHYTGAVSTFRALVPRTEAVASYPKIAPHNAIDSHVHRRLEKLNIIPSEVADDAEFLRRAYLDVIGTLPTPAEARRFLDDKSSWKRATLIDELLERPEFADYWALQWSDVLRVDRQLLGHKRAYNMVRWIRDSLAANKPYDRFVRELLTAEGPLTDVGPASFYKVVAKPGEAASTLSQVFLGVRIACAECHHHPFDRWSQTDYYGMQAFFTPLGIRQTGRGEVLVSQGDPVTKHPRTGEIVQPHALGTKMPEQAPTGDRRLVLAEWMTSPDNPWFARNFANRIWAHFLGRGLIEPVDDVRDTNPPSNPELLDALAEHAIQTKFDVKAMIRFITASRTYQLSSKPNETNEQDTLNFSRSVFRRVHAEVLLDMVSQTTGIAEKFPGMPPGTRAIQVWDSKVQHYFLKLFGRPQRNTACECERVHEPTVSQVLHLLNSPGIQNKLSHDRGVIARLVGSIKDDGVLVDELYLTFFSRLPSAAEKGFAVEHLRKGERRPAAEDLAWSMMNSVEFVFNH